MRRLRARRSTCIGADLLVMDREEAGSSARCPRARPTRSAAQLATADCHGGGDRWPRGAGGGRLTRACPTDREPRGHAPWSTPPAPVTRSRRACSPTSRTRGRRPAELIAMALDAAVMAGLAGGAGARRPGTAPERRDATDAGGGVARGERRWRARRGSCASRRRSPRRSRRPGGGRPRVEPHRPGPAGPAQPRDGARGRGCDPRRGGACRRRWRVDAGRLLVGAAGQLLERLADPSTAQPRVPRATSVRCLPRGAWRRRRSAPRCGSRTGRGSSCSRPAASAGSTAAPSESFDVSSDIDELAATPVAVVCCGAKSILDLPATLELLETRRVPVIGIGVDELPAFYAAALRPARPAHAVADPDEAADCAGGPSARAGLPAASSSSSRRPPRSRSTRPTWTLDRGAPR